MTTVPSGFCPVTYTAPGYRYCDEGSCPYGSKCQVSESLIAQAVALVRSAAMQSSGRCVDVSEATIRALIRNESERR